MTADDRANEEALEKAKRELAEMHGRPFDVDKVLAQERAKEDRRRSAERIAAEKLDRVVKDARERRHIFHERQLESDAKVLSEKQGHLEEAKLKEAAKLRKSTRVQKGPESK